ncbi:MAG TPA: phosphoribosylformylglycinamidine cyclo-ligase, partial [Myxococcota bacterium]|nr:phosphoribosylformylglycinamidine cyclo-ligase [Myxococcota bacterium]
MSLTYKEAGVDIEAADAFVQRIGKLARSTHGPGVVPHRTEYASLFRPDLGGMQDPLIAATCDGVGTKLLVAREMGKYTGLGQDLVGMNVNDLLPSGARPLLFLDYIATGKLDPDALTAVVDGMARACRDAGCALLGGETAEMPGVYAAGEFDLAGFAVGLVDGARIPDLGAVAVGDQVLALPASGVHSNGLSLARKALLERGGLHLTDAPQGLTQCLGDEL